MYKITVTKDEILKFVEDELMKKGIFKKRTSANNLSLNLALPMKTEAPRAKLVYSPAAWIKSWWLVNKSAKEIAWEGIMERRGEHEFYVKDILVYPQIVTAIHVDTDTVAYPMWRMELPDEMIPTLLLEGHSHVDMAATPSQTDRNLYDDLLQRVPEDKFVVFCILNVDGDHYVELYDFKNNIRYQTEDIDVEVEGMEINKFWDESFARTREVKPAAQTASQISRGYPAQTAKQAFSNYPSATNPFNSEVYDSYDDQYDDYYYNGFHYRDYRKPNDGFSKAPKTEPVKAVSATPAVPASKPIPTTERKPTSEIDKAYISKFGKRG